MKARRVIDSLDYGWNEGEFYFPHGHPPYSLTLTEDDSLEAWHTRQGEYDTESQAFFAIARARLRTAFEAGLLKKELSMQQYGILYLLFREGKTMREIAELLHTPIENVDNQVIKLVKKLQRFFK